MATSVIIEKCWAIMISNFIFLFYFFSLMWQRIEWIRDPIAALNLGDVLKLAWHEPNCSVLGMYKHVKSFHSARCSTVKAKLLKGECPSKFTPRSHRTIPRETAKNLRATSPRFCRPQWTCWILKFMRV